MGPATSRGARDGAGARRSRFEGPATTRDSNPLRAWQVGPSARGQVVLRAAGGPSTRPGQNDCPSSPTDARPHRRLMLRGRRALAGEPASHGRAFPSGPGPSTCGSGLVMASDVPGDFSAGGAFSVAQRAATGSELTIHGKVGIKPRRTGLLKRVAAGGMGALASTIFNRHKIRKRGEPDRRPSEPSGADELTADPRWTAEEVPRNGSTSLAAFVSRSPRGKGEGSEQGGGEQGSERRAKEAAPSRKTEDRHENRHKLRSEPLASASPAKQTMASGLKEGGPSPPLKGGAAESHGWDHFGLRCFGRVWAGLASREGVRAPRDGGRAVAVKLPPEFFRACWTGYTNDFVFLIVAIRRAGGAGKSNGSARRMAKRLGLPLISTLGAMYRRPLTWLAPPAAAVPMGKTEPIRRCSAVRASGQLRRAGGPRLDRRHRTSPHRIRKADIDKRPRHGGWRATVSAQGEFAAGAPSQELAADGKLS